MLQSKGWLDTDGWKPISYVSRFMNEAELKYSINELELLAVVWAVTHYQNYLLRAPFKIATNHKALLSYVT